MQLPYLKNGAQEISETFRYERIKCADYHGVYRNSRYRATF